MFSSINEFELNRNDVSTNQDFISMIDLLSQIRDFLSELGYLFFGRDMSVLKCIASHPSARKAVKEFQLKDSFDKLADKLNNYVHSNGHRFYNESYARLVTKNKIKEECKEFGEAAIYITISFLFFVVLINPLLIMSYDYTDYLDVGDTPPDGSQYWVAPFVSDFLDNHKNVLDDRYVSCLREKTGMQI